MSQSDFQDLAYLTVASRKAQASILAVDERQSLETLSRDEKTSSRALTQLKEKKEAFDTRRAKLLEEQATQTERRKEVRFHLVFRCHVLTCV